MWITFAISAVALLAFGLTLLTAYLLVLTVAAFFARRSGPPVVEPTRRFAILVPAHDEEALIGRLLSSLNQLEYPRDLFDVCVVADNCRDSTATRAAASGARVYERFDLEQQSKGFALRWLLEQLRAEGQTYDAFVVLDADSVVPSNFLRAMNSRLAAGSQVIQAYYSVYNAGQSTVASLRFAATSQI